MLKQGINVDDDIIHVDISKFKIFELKRKQPEPHIPFNQNQPFVNPLSEPNLELLNIAINISLKRFKSREEEELIFPSDVDAEILNLEGKFSESLRLLGDYVKNKIKGRGVSTVRRVCEAADRSNMLRITTFNHEEELLRQQQLSIAIQESIRTASQAVSVLTLEKSLYEQAVEVEQAKIAAEAEYKKRAEQEALNFIVDKVVHIATIETQKLAQQHVMVPPADTVMTEAAPEISDSDKGKGILFGPTSPVSPQSARATQVSPSSTIPSAIQEALEGIRHEMKDEMNILRADMREDTQRSEEVTHKKIDAMMAMLMQLTQHLPKP
jgi:hypothetical protein